MIKRIMFFLSIFIQFSGIILAMIFEDLSDKKMGVARYLVFKNQEFSSTLFTPPLMNLYTVIFAVGAVTCMVLLFLRREKRRGNVHLLLAAIANLAGILFIQFQPDLQAYHFFLIGIFIIIVFQYYRVFSVIFHLYAKA